MPKFKARVEVFLRGGYSDPEGQTTGKSLVELDYPVSGVSVSKVYSILLEANDVRDARRKVEDMCKELLVNPNKDDFKITIKNSLSREGE